MPPGHMLGSLRVCKWLYNLDVLLLYIFLNFQMGKCCVAETEIFSVLNFCDFFCLCLIYLFHTLICTSSGLRNMNATYMYLSHFPSSGTFLQTFLTGNCRHYSP